MKFFIYDNINERVALNKEGLLLIKEFSDLMKESRNITKTDKTGKHKERAFKEFTYIYLFFDWESPFFNDPEQDRHTRALDNSGLTGEEFEDPLFRIACNKYDEIQNAHISIRLLRAAMKSVDTVIYYLENVDVNERSEVDGKPIFKTKDLITEIKGCKDLIVSLQELERQVKKEMEPDSGLRGGAEAGFFDTGQSIF